LGPTQPARLAVDPHSAAFASCAATSRNRAMIKRDIPGLQRKGFHRDHAPDTCPCLFAFLSSSLARSHPRVDRGPCLPPVGMLRRRTLFAAAMASLVLPTMDALAQPGPPPGPPPGSSGGRPPPSPPFGSRSAPRPTSRSTRRSAAAKSAPWAQAARRASAWSTAWGEADPPTDAAAAPRNPTASSSRLVSLVLGTRPVALERASLALAAGPLAPLVPCPSFSY
jgi:hypothetical protein